MVIKNIDTGTSTYIGEPLDSIGSNRGIKGMHCNSFYLSSNEACSERGRENAKNVEMGETSTLRPIVIKKVETLCCPKCGSTQISNKTKASVYVRILMKAR